MVPTFWSCRLLAGPADFAVESASSKWCTADHNESILSGIVGQLRKHHHFHHATMLALPQRFDCAEILASTRSPAPAARKTVPYIRF
jgi:hypothetical protein